MARVVEVTGRPGRGSSYHCPVPEHDDRSPSLSINPGENQPVVFECHAGCGFNAVLEALGISTREFFGRGNSRWAPPLPRLDRPLRPPESTPGAVGPEAPHGPNFFDYAERVCHYDYEDESGELTLRKIRWRKRAGAPEDLSPKCFTWQRLEAGRWKNGLGGHEPRLYRQARVADAAPIGEWIFLVEGEKDVESVERLGLVATTGHKPGALTPAQARALEGTRVVIIPDNDPSGQGQAQRRLESTEGIAQEVVWLELPVEKEGGDVTDWIEAGGTAPELIKLVEAARKQAALRPVPVDGSKASADSGQLTELNDVGFAERLFERHGRDLLWDKARKRWLRWVDSRWRDDDGETVFELTRDLRAELKEQISELQEIQEQPETSKEEARAIGAEIRKQFKAHERLASNYGQKELFQVLRRRGELHVTPADMDADRYLCQMPCGDVLDVSSGSVRPARREDRIMKRIGVDMDGAATPKQWLAFLNTISCGDLELAHYIASAAAYSVLTGDTGIQHIFFCYGGGANGKSTLMEVLFGIAGDYGARLPARVLMTNSNAHSAYIADLFGKRFVASEEITSNRLDESLVKELTGGDRVKAERKYENPFEFVPELKLWITGNDKPRIRGTNEGIWRRVRLLPFTQDLRRLEGVKVVPNYAQFLLAEEGPGILRHLVELAQSVLEAGCLPQCQAVESATQRYREEEDLFGGFLQETYEVTGDASDLVATVTIASDYAEWLGKDGTKQQVSGRMIGREMSSRSFAKRESAVPLHGKRVNGWAGLRRR